MTNNALTTLRSLLGNDDVLVARFVGIFKNQTPDQMASSGEFWKRGLGKRRQYRSRHQESVPLFRAGRGAMLCQHIEDDPPRPETSASWPNWSSGW